MVEVPRIAREREAVRRIRAAERELVHRQLAEQHGACLSQASGGGGVLSGNAVCHDLGACRRLDAVGVVQVLERDGYAVHGAAIVAAQDFGFSLPRLCHRSVVQHGDVAFQRVVEFVDAIEEYTGKLDGGELAAFDQDARLADGEVVEFRGHGYTSGSQPGA